MKSEGRTLPLLNLLKLLNRTRRHRAHRGGDGCWKHPPPMAPQDVGHDRERGADEE